jgi:hypothetical protein
MITSSFGDISMSIGVDSSTMAYVNFWVSVFILLLILICTKRVYRIARDVKELQRQLNQVVSNTARSGSGGPIHSWTHTPVGEAIVTTEQQEEAAMAEFIVEDQEFALKNKQFAQLIKSDALILNEDEETYELNPKHMFTYDEVKMMLLGTDAP